MTTNPDYTSNTVSPYIGIVFLILTALIIFLAVFYYYLRERCSFRRRHHRTAATSPVRRDRSGSGGLDPAVVKSFPELEFSDAKANWASVGLECAVCLSPFEDHETLRLMPKCGHVFHADCVGIWLANHTTCPCCRADLRIRDFKSNDVVLDVGNVS